MCSSDSVSFSLCDCGLAVEGRASHGFDPTGDGGFSDLAQHLADRTATVVQGCYSLKDRFLLCVAVFGNGGFQKESAPYSSAATLAMFTQKGTLPIRFQENKSQYSSSGGPM